MHEVFVDYLQASLLYREETCIEQGNKELSGFGFYTRGYEDKLGVRRFFGNPNSKKALVVYGGRALHNRRVVSWGDRELVNELLSRDANITRIDWAITDYIDIHLVTPKLIAVLYRKGKITGKLADYGANHISGEKVGSPPKIETFYIGDHQKRGDHGIFRSYDKGLDLGIWSDLICRHELEERKSLAHNSAKRYADGNSIQSIMRSRLEIVHEQTSRLFDAKPIDLSRGENLIESGEAEKMNKKWTWLYKQVAPAVRKMVQYERRNSGSDVKLHKFLELCGIVGTSSNESIERE